MNSWWLMIDWWYFRSSQAAIQQCPRIGCRNEAPAVAVTLCPRKQLCQMVGVAGLVSDVLKNLLGKRSSWSSFPCGVANVRLRPERVRRSGSCWSCCMQHLRRGDPRQHPGDFADRDPSEFSRSLHQTRPLVRGRWEMRSCWGQVLALTSCFTFHGFAGNAIDEWVILATDNTCD